MSFLSKSLATLLAIAPSFVLAVPRPDRSVERAVSGTQTAVVTVTQSGKGPVGSEYFGDITVNGQVHRVLFDTGSNDLWINNHGQKGTGPSFYQGYGSGSVNGTVEHGNVTVGGITVHNQAYGLVYHATDDDAYFDGILGLGSSDKQLITPETSETSWLKNVMPMLKEPIFAADLAPDTGTFTFGYDNRSSTGTNSGGDAGFLPVSTRNAGWDISAGLYGLDSTVPCDLDTGTTDVLLPTDAYNAYSRGVNKQDQHPPDLEVTSNGHAFTMPGKYAGDGGKLIHSSGKNTACILGQPFIYAFHLVYDYANKRVSLTPKA